MGRRQGAMVPGCKVGALLLPENSISIWLDYIVLILCCAKLRYIVAVIGFHVLAQGLNHDVKLCLN